MCCESILANLTKTHNHTQRTYVTISFHKLDQSLIHNLLCITARTKVCEYSLHETLLMMGRLIPKHVELTKSAE